MGQWEGPQEGLEGLRRDVPRLDGHYMDPRTITVADFIADVLVSNGITQIFSVVGGGAMYLNDSLGHHPKLSVLYNHHEQASAIAAESYARLTNRIAAVCVTSGPGGTNALTGCLCGYMGSIPMLILSGQVRYPFTVRGSGLPLRTVGEQEFDICKAAESMTKYCEMVTDPQTIRIQLEKALFLATRGRPGPCWLDIPLDVQNARIIPEQLPAFDWRSCADMLPPPVDQALLREILERIEQAERPVLYVGMGVRLAGAFTDFEVLVERLGIPVVTGINSVDFMLNEHPLYAGRAGVTGDRAGNFAVQNSDLILAIGNRLSLKHTGYNLEAWARAAYKIVCDIDRYELQRESLKIDRPIWADAGDLIRGLLQRMRMTHLPAEHHQQWITRCRTWVQRYPVVTNSHYQTPDGKANIYAFYHELSKVLVEDDIIVTTAGTARVAGAQAMKFKHGQRFIVNVTAAPMGYCLPAAIGVSMADRSKAITLVAADGGLQMNLQELQTIRHHKLPIRMIVINNNGYHSVRQTQSNYFSHHKLVGIGDDSGDLSFPELSPLAAAYGFPYMACRSNQELPEVLNQLVRTEAPLICEIFVTTSQKTEPKSASKRLPDGRMVSAPLEDMAPFLERDELVENMMIPLVDSS
jgi:acetolactate synthase-1/2/3 large subunit